MLHWIILIQATASLAPKASYSSTMEGVVVNCNLRLFAKAVGLGLGEGCDKITATPYYDRKFAVKRFLLQLANGSKHNFLFSASRVVW